MKTRTLAKGKDFRVSTDVDDDGNDSGWVCVTLSDVEGLEIDALGGCATKVKLTIQAAMFQDLVEGVAKKVWPRWDLATWPVPKAVE